MFHAMRVSLPFARLLFSAALCLLLIAPAVPALSADAKPKAPAAAGKKSAAPAAETPENLKARLEEFGKTVAESYNRTVLHNITKKEVTNTSGGGFTASYQAIDPQSIKGSFVPATNPKSPVKYIGTLTYAEMTYTCTAPTREAALKGPFTASRTMTTELVKYVNGKWTY
jgi:hypothetical protein